ncbi:MAG TPA: hypothetical protein VFD32_06295 [Dehalococcoidia bacterium]|nr:hypothetical protein [Dehalococcoidia bacterium]
MLLCSPDLMLGVRVESAATALGYRLHTAASPAEVAAAVAAQPPAAAVIDLAAIGDGLVESVAALQSAHPAPFLLGFFPHVQRELGAAGREAGCALVVPRSRFMAELPALLRQAVEAQPAASATEAQQK